MLAGIGEQPLSNVRPGRIAVGLLERSMPTPKAIRLLSISISALQTDNARAEPQMMLEL
jgi:hypothetical protein